MSMLSGVFTALVTPFRETGGALDSEIDWDSFGDLIETQINAGIHGLVPCGTTGESPTLSREEYDQVVRFVVERG